MWNNEDITRSWSYMQITSKIHFGDIFKVTQKVHTIFAWFNTVKHGSTWTLNKGWYQSSREAKITASTNNNIVH